MFHPIDSAAVRFAGGRGHHPPHRPMPALRNERRAEPDPTTGDGRARDDRLPATDGRRPGPARSGDSVPAAALRVLETTWRLWREPGSPA